MALIGMAVYSTEDNGKDEFLRRTLESLRDTVDFSKHRLILSVNAQTDKTHKTFYVHNDIISEIIYNDTNIGTAEAINKAWKTRQEGENAIKMDDDVVIYQEGWIEEMEEAIRRDNTIGIIGLKRKDCWENPDHPDGNYKSTLIMLPHESGEKWMIVEQVKHVIGTCQMYSDALLTKIGYLYQPKLYGFDDVLAAARSHKAGFKNVFLPHIEIDHIDPGGTLYQKWKEDHAGECWKEVNQALSGYASDLQSIYYNPFK